jgi:hypothetical protein
MTPVVSFAKKAKLKMCILLVHVDGLYHRALLKHFSEHMFAWAVAQS